ncbi:MAG: hypothetical protein QXI12_02645 [Candidatus Methanomethyliaceae archaeon]
MVFRKNHPTSRMDRRAMSVTRDRKDLPKEGIARNGPIDDLSRRLKSLKTEGFLEELIVKRGK